MCCQKKMFVMFCNVFFFPPGVYVRTLNFIALLPDPFTLTFKKLVAFQQHGILQC